jgi:hypothetical protein
MSPFDRKNRVIAIFTSDLPGDEKERLIAQEFMLDRSDEDCRLAAEADERYRTGLIKTWGEGINFIRNQARLHALITY